jgi:uncharacterized membrane protein
VPLDFRRIAEWFEVPLERLQKWREDILSSLWLVPTVYACAAIVLSFVMPEIDNRVQSNLESYRTWIFLGSASAARSILSVIAGSLITVISLVFSITILTLHQASSQYTPRIIRTFVNDRANQSVLGAFLATFLYSILVMRRIRGEDGPGPESIPVLSITVSVFLALVCLMLLVYFIHHVALEFLPATVIGRVHRDLLAGVDRLYPERIGDPTTHDEDDLAHFRSKHHDSRAERIVADAAGFIRAVDDRAITDNLNDGEWAAVLPKVGTYVLRGQPIIEVGRLSGPLSPRTAKLRDALILDAERTMTQDALFGVRQLADIALKGLSPSIHDPTTAEQALSSLGDALASLAMREFPARTRIIERDSDGVRHRIMLWLNRPTFADFVDVAFSQARSVARDNVHVTLHILETLQALAYSIPESRAEAVQIQIAEILWYAEHQSSFSPRDRSLIRTQALRVMSSEIYGA